MTDDLTPPIEVVRNFFTADDWPFEDASDQMLRTSYGGDSGQWVVVAEVRPSYQRFICFSILPERVPAERRAAVAEYLARVNHGVSYGNFDLDFDTGEVRYRTSIDVADEKLTEGLVKQVVYGNVLTVDLWVPGLRAVIDEGLAPGDALAR